MEVVSDNVEVAPLINPCVFEKKEDLERMIESSENILKALTSDPLKAIIEKPSLLEKLTSKKDIEKYILDNSSLLWAK